jgi:tetratricopeptide (TPR) repeat protein
MTCYRLGQPVATLLALLCLALATRVGAGEAPEPKADPAKPEAAQPAEKAGAEREAEPAKPEPAPPAEEAEPEPEPEKPEPAEPPPAPEPEEKPEPGSTAQDLVEAKKLKAKGDVHFARGNWDEALAAYREAEKLGEDSALSLFRVAWIEHTQRGAPDRAVPYYEKAIARDGGLLAALSNLAEIRRRQKRYAEAEKLLERALKRQPNYTDALYNLARTRDDMGRTSEAFEGYLKVLQLNPTYAEAYSNAGLVLMEVGNIERAARFFRKAIKFDARFTDAYANLGVALYRAGHFEGALKPLGRAIELEPDNARYRLYLAELYEKTGQLDEAVESLLHAASLRPEDAAIHSSLGVVYLRRNEPILAVESLGRAVALRPKDAGDWFRLGLAWKARRDYARAHIAYEKAASLGWTGPRGVLDFELGICLNSLDRTAEAQKFYDKALKANGEDVEFLNSAALNLMRLERLDEAQKLLEQAVEVDPLEPASHFNLGHVLSGKGRDVEAAESFRRGLDEDRKDVYPTLWLAHALMRADRWAEAQLVLNEAVKHTWPNEWEQHLVRQAAGLESEEEMMRAADSPDKRCEGLFYAAERLAALGRKDAARQRYEACRAMKIYDFYEHNLAFYRLKAPGGARTVPAQPSAQR